MRLIDADELIIAFEPYHDCDWYTPWIIKKINEAPTIEAVPVVRGEWKCVDEENEAWECSVCGKVWCLYGTPIDNGMNYCPKCGADMRKKVE